MIDRRIVVLGPLVALTAGLLWVGSNREQEQPDTLSPDIASGATDPLEASVAAIADVTGSSPATNSTATSIMSTSTTTTTTTATTTTIPLVPDDGKRSDERRLVEAFLVEDPDLQPKSVVASGTGLFFAQNMMYRHNVSVFDRSGNKVAEIPDQVDLAAFGVSGGVVAQGSPVEAAFTPDGRYVYVSNYKMFGDGYNPVADDGCGRGDWDDSFVYKIDTATFEIVSVVTTGAVPKFLAVTPDGSRLLVSNWCGFDVSVIDTASDTELGRTDVGRHPRGIAIRSDSEIAYVTVMGEAEIVVIDIDAQVVVNTVPDPGNTPRHVLLSPDDRYLYVSNHTMNSVRKIDLQQGEVDAVVTTGTETRTMALADDGESLYVVNYVDGTVTKLRTSDMTELQTVYSGVHPVGITYDPVSRQVWIANYAGSLRVFVDQ